MGDSITFAQHLPREQAWTSLLADSTGWDVENHGVNGDTTRLALERITPILDGQPDIVVYQFGLNDCNRWVTDRGLPRVSLPAFRANLAELVERAWKFKASRVVLVGVTPCLAVSLLEPGEYHRAILQTALVEVFVPGLFADLHLMSDGVHLNADGHREFAVQLEDMLCRH